MKVVIISEILRSKKLWIKEYEKRYDYVKNHIGEDGALEKMVAFKLNPYDEVRKIYITDYIVNLIMWQPFIKFMRSGDAMDESDIFNCDNITQDQIKNYIDKAIIKRFRRKVPVRQINVECAKIIERLKNINEDFGLIMAMTINIYDTINLMRKVPEYKSILYTTIPDKMQPSEVERYVGDLSNSMINILRTHDNNLKPFLDSGVGINTGQLNEYAIVEGYKPDLEGNLYNVPINTNLFVRGLDTPAHYMLDAAAGRKALIMNKTFTGVSGYFARRLDLLTLDIMLHKDDEFDCKTKHLVKFTVDTPATLRKIDDRYYKLKPSDRITRLIDASEDFHLIGKTIYLRSPMTCASKDGVCPKCYGALSYINSDIHIGLNAAKELSAKLTQMILSAKHLLKARAIKMQMSKGFDDMFAMDGGDIILNPVLTNKTYSIVMNLSDIETEDDFGDSTEYSRSITHFRIMNKKGEFIYTIREVGNVDDDNKYYISKYLEGVIDRVGYIEEGKLIIPIKTIDTDEILFTMRIINNELTKPLRDIMSLLDNKNHLDCNTIDDIVQKFARLLIESRLSTQLVHGEILMRNIIRDTQNQLRNPDYSQDEIDYKMLSVKSALKRHPSIVVSLAFERLEEQLTNPTSYSKEDGSLFDPLFRVR